MTMPTHAMVLAAGHGLRMRPLTEHTPKPLIPVAGRCMLDRTLDRLDDVKVSHRVVNAHWLGEQVAAHLANHAGTTISHEDTLLETGGGVAYALPLLGDKAFFVCNADIIWIDGARPALARLAEAWDDARMDALLLVVPVAKAFGYDGAGDFHCQADGALRRRAKDERAAHVFTGVQILHPRLFAGVPKGAFSLNVLYDRAQTAGRLHGVIHDGDWLHIGTPQALTEAEAWFAARAARKTNDSRKS
jgi:MurNAc alpha-1-phosphate uridylyltransferase